MTPTPKLRWIEREHEVGLTGNMVHVETVLQQWFVEPPITVNLDTGEMVGSYGEWRDVPTHEEREKDDV
jgi:hypothetical protein